MSGVLSEAELEEEVRRDFARRGYDVGPVAMEGVARILEERQSAPAQSVQVVLSTFALPDFVAGGLAFVRGLAPEVRRAWYRRFTQATYLVGRPSTIVAHAKCPHRLSPSGAIGWFGPARPGGVFRSLPPLRTCALAAFADLWLPVNENGGDVELVIDRSQLPTLEAYLVALGHALADGFEQGFLAEARRLHVTHVERFATIPSDRSWSRLHESHHTPGELVMSAYAHRIS